MLKNGLGRRRPLFLIVAFDVAQSEAWGVAVAYEPQQIDGLMFRGRSQQVQNLDIIGVGPTLVAVGAVTQVALAAVTTGRAASIALRRSAPPTRRSELW